MLPHPDDRTWNLAQAELAIRAALPALQVGTLRHLGRGWDADVFTDEVWCFRFARNALAAQGMLREPALLSWLAPRLTLPIPLPSHCTLLDDARTPLLVSPLIPGKTVCDAGLARQARAALARPLAAFIRALHALDPDESPLGLEVALARVDDDAQRRTASLARLERLEKSGVLARSLAAALADALAVEPPPCDGSPERVVHGDLHTRNLLTHEGALTGVIDWVDVHRGEAARDLASAFMVLPPEAHPTFLAAYGPVEPRTWQRSRFRALVHMVATLDQAGERNDQAFAATTLVALGELAEQRR
jgi:aminoglycoside phosphotransferase (APT) family kinase protein